MPQSLAQIHLHIVFSTKNREPFLRRADLRLAMHAYLAGCCKNLDSAPATVGGTEDHVHILCRLSRKYSAASLVREVKRGSSRWVKTQEGCSAEFRWQEGYGAFSVSPVHVAAVERYIAEQEQHHRKFDFQSEFRRLLQKYGVDYDERYVWD